MIDLDNQTDLKVPIDLCETIAQSLSERDIDLLITDDIQIQKINAEYRQIDKATDVLSFPFEDSPMAPLGSIVISADHVKKVASELHHCNEEEFCLLFIHGLLHLMGYDHETDNGEMRRKEQALIQTFKLPDSLIVRTENTH